MSPAQLVSKFRTSLCGFRIAPDVNRTVVISLEHVCVAQQLEAAPSALHFSVSVAAPSALHFFLHGGSVDVGLG